MILEQPPLLITTTSAIRVVAVGSLFPGSEECRNIYSIFESQRRSDKMPFLFVCFISAQTRPPSPSLEGNIAFLKSARIFSQGFPHRYTDHFLYKIESLWAKSPHKRLHLHKEDPILMISRVESVLGSYWFSHRHTDKGKACAPGNRCYLKQFAERTLMGFAVWQAQKTPTGAESPEFTAGAAMTERGGKDTFLCWWWISVRSPPVANFSKYGEGKDTLQRPMSVTKEAGRSIQLLRQWTEQNNLG